MRLLDRLQDAASDRALFKRLAKGDVAALEELYDRHSRKLYAHSMWLCRHREDAEDVVQAVFVKLAREASKLAGIRRPTAWLHRITRNQALDHLRKHRRHGEVALEAAAGMGQPQALPDPDLERALERLPAEQNEVVRLHLQLGLRFREIAEVQQVSTHTAASRYKLAIARLRKELGDD